MQRLVRFRCIVQRNAVNARQVGATALVRFRCIVDSVVRFLQRSERTPGRCNGLVRFHCIVDSVVRFFATQ